MTSFRFPLAVLLLGLASLVQAAVVERQTLAPERVVSAARGALDNKLGSDRESAMVTVIGQPERIVLPAGRLAVEAGAITGPWPRSRVGVPVSVSLNGHVVRAATVWFAIGLHREVLGYAADASRGLSGEKLVTAPTDVDVAAVHGTLMKDAADLRGKRLRRSVVEGAPVIEEDFEMIPDVDRQQRIEVRVAYHGIRLMTHGMSTRMGYAGDVVPVQVDGAAELVRARVIGKGEVQVVE